MKSWIKIGIAAGAAYVLYNILHKNPQGANNSYDLAFFQELIEQGKNLSMGEYPYVFVYEIEKDTLHPNKPGRIVNYTQFAATKSAWIELNKTVPTLDYFVQGQYINDIIE